MTAGIPPFVLCLREVGKGGQQMVQSSSLSGGGGGPESYDGRVASIPADFSCGGRDHRFRLTSA